MPDISEKKKNKKKNKEKNKKKENKKTSSQPHLPPTPQKGKSNSIFVTVLFYKESEHSTSFLIL